MYEYVAIVCSIITFHLSKLCKVKFSILCDVIFLVRLQGNFDIDQGKTLSLLSSTSTFSQPFIKKVKMYKCRLRSWRSQSMRPNSVHGCHFVLVADGRLRASDKIMGRGVGSGWGSFTTPPSPSTHCNFVISPQSPTCYQNKMVPVNTVRPHRLRLPATQASISEVVWIGLA